MRHSSEANRTSMLLVAAGPCQTQKAECNGRRSLYVCRRWREGWHEQTTEVHGSVENDGRRDGDLREQEYPKPASSGKRRLLRATAVLAYGWSAHERQHQQPQQNSAYGQCPTAIVEVPGSA